MSIHFSSQSDEWATPNALFDALNREFAFTLDAASSRENAKCEQHFTLEDNALTQDWTDTEGAVWCNPPYNRIDCPKFIAKAARTAEQGKAVVMLIANRPNAAWFKHIYEATDPANPASPVINRPGVEVRPIASRVKFGDAKTGAPFPSVVIIFRPTS